MRKPIYDTFKNRSQLRADQGKTCTIDGCDNPITAFRGPGSDCLCREHQIDQVEYGGMGKIARPHTFHRKWVCSECGWDILSDPRLADVQNEETKRRIARILSHGDHHLERKADGGDDSATNVRPLCVVCHAKKTALNEDWRRSNKSDMAT